MGGLAPGTGLYNGNIVGMKWGINDETIRGYQFSYDDLNRLIQGNYAEGSGLDIHAGYNTEIITEYDDNGNIQGLQRKYNNTLVDGLTYTYNTNSNQINYITDSGSSTSEIEDYPGNSTNYTYDSNGNMTYDGAKNIDIEYFLTLNLPQELDFGNNNKIFYHYTTSGIKLVKHTIPYSGTPSTINYIGNIVYEGSTLSYIITDEGRLVPFGTGSDRIFKYEYNLKDHLGDNRVLFMGTNLGGAIDIVQTSSYYPFGLVMSKTEGNTSSNYQKNKYLYNSKELQDDVLNGSSLNWYDYGARFYDPQVGRWTTIDPLSEINKRWSPYRFAYDNPLRYFDPDGMLESTHTDEKGNIVAVYDDGDKGVYKHKGNSKQAKKEVEKNYSKSNTSAGGKKIGNTPRVNTFLDEKGTPLTGTNVFSMKAGELYNKSSDPKDQKQYFSDWLDMVEYSAPEFSKDKYEVLRTYKANTGIDKFYYSEPIRIFNAFGTSIMDFFMKIGSQSHGPYNTPSDLLNDGLLILESEKQKDKTKYQK